WIKAVLLFDKEWSVAAIAEALLLSEDAIREHINEYRESKKLKLENGGSTQKIFIEQSNELAAHLRSYTESNSRIGLFQGCVRDLSQTKPIPKQINLRSLSMQGDLKSCGCSTQKEPILESRAVYTYLYVKDIIAYVQSAWSVTYLVPGMRN